MELVKVNDYGPIIDLVIDDLTSPHSKTTYRRSLRDFLDWWERNGGGQPTKAMVNSYKSHLVEEGMNPSNINQRLAAIRKMSVEAADNGLLDPVLASGISRVKGLKNGGTHIGNWLTKGEAQMLLDVPDGSLRGIRDRAIFAVFLGCGLRRAELVSLRFADIQQRAGRWVIVDLNGKGNKIRTVPVPSWVKVLIDEWSEASGLTDGFVFVGLAKGGAINISRKAVSSHSVYHALRHWAAKAGIEAGIAPHDLRRTFAKLCHGAGAKLEQIQVTLGHASIQTTEVYLGLEQDLTEAPCDKWKLDVTPHQSQFKTV